MFAARYFPSRFYADRYYPPIGAVLTIFVADESQVSALYFESQVSALYFESQVSAR